MSMEKYMDEDDVIRKAIEVLLKELGPIETTRFINMPKKKRIESVKRHREWQKQLDKEKEQNKVLTQTDIKQKMEELDNAQRRIENRQKLGEE